MRHYPCSVAAVVLLAVCSLGFAEDAAYPIKLHRDCKVGDSYNTRITYENSNATTLKAPPAAPKLKKEAFKGQLEGCVKVLAINAIGNASSFTIVVKKFADDEGKEIIPADQIIEVTRGEEEVTFALKGGTALSNEAKAILSFLYRPDRGASTDDDSFGTDKPQNVGASWPINAEASAKSAVSAGITVDPKDVAGSVTFKAVEKTSAGAPALRLAATMTVKNPKLSIPANATLESCTVKVTFGGLFPVDAAALAAESSLSMDMTIHMVRDGVNLERVAHMAQKEVITSMK